ncbi:MAG TPA: cob(I)yrinic acid a,c-diamide adenosyltransferase [Chloroflexia bacterium]|nr:cob(I)yrinic acid a,c-diamide adenosyltransferase [Chloroflexia bacterium]
MSNEPENKLEGVSEETEADTTANEESQEEEDDRAELEELQKMEAAGPQPGETREQFAARLHEAQVALHKKNQAKRKERKSQAKGLVVVNTGNGKGKTTAALGVLFRAWGRGMRVCMLQFIKSTTSNYGENRAAKRLGIEIIPMGDGFTWLSEDIEKDKATARECWKLCKEKIFSGDYDIVILDEMTYALSYGWLDVNEVIETLKQRPADQHIIITGRNALPELVEYADLVTEMTEIKHPYKQGIKAQKGLEF